MEIMIKAEIYLEREIKKKGQTHKGKEKNVKINNIRIVSY